MGSVTHVDFQAGRAEALENADRHPRETGDWADQVADVWRSPIVQFMACAAVFTVVMTGLGLVVLFAALVLGRI